MSETRSQYLSLLPTISLRRVVTTPFRLRTYGILFYHMLALPLGMTYFIFLSVSLPITGLMSVFLIGIPGFLVVLLISAGLVTFERHLASALLGIEINAPRWKFRSQESITEKVKYLIVDPSIWLGLIFLASKLLIGIIALTALLLILIPTITFLTAPLYYQTPGVRVGLFLPSDISRELSLYVPWDELLVGFSYVIQISSWEVSTIWDAIFVSGFGVVLLLLGLAILNGLGWVFAQWTRLLVGEKLRQSTNEMANQ